MKPEFILYSHLFMLNLQDISDGFFEDLGPEIILQFFSILWNNSMELSLSWEINRCTATREPARILLKARVHYYVQKSLCLISILSYMNPIQNLNILFLWELFLYLIGYCIFLVGSFLWGFLQEPCLHHSPMRAIYPAQLILFDLIILAPFG